MVNSVKNYNEQPLSTEAEWESTIIDNSPYVRDLFNKIKEVVSCSVDPIGLTIALTGALGSGKSSIVKQTLRKLKKEEYSCLELSENNSEENLGNDSEQQLVDAEVADSSSHNEGSPVARKIELNISEFRCLWFQNDEALLLGFIEHLSAQISSIDKEAATELLKRALPKLISGGLRAFQIVSPFIGIPFLDKAVETGIKLSEDIADSKKEANESSESIENLLSSLHEALEQKNAKESKKRILIVLDDLDRLDSNEVLAMFRLIKTFGNLPNIIFLLVYDNDIISAIVDKHFPESKGKYLDKFIQLRVNMLPARSQIIVDQLKDSVLNSCDVTECPYMAKKLSNDVYFCSEQYISDLENMKQDKSNASEMTKDEGYVAKLNKGSFNVDSLIAYNLCNARDVSLIKNAVATSWEFCQHQISLSDIIVIEILKQYHNEELTKIYRDIDLYNFSDGLYDQYDQEVNRTPFICDWKYQITPFSQSLSNPSLLTLYFFGGDYIEGVLKKGLPDFFSMLNELNCELSSDKFDELLEALIKNIVITEIRYNEDTTELRYDGSESHLFRCLECVVTYFMIGRIDDPIVNWFIKQFYQVTASKHFKELVERSINKENDKLFSICVADIISKWFVRAIIDNEVYKTNRFFQNSSLLEQLASIKEKNILFFFFLATSYRELANIRHSSNAIRSYTIFYDLLLEQIVSGELLNSKYGLSLLVEFQDFLSKIQNTKSELYEPLKQSFIKIKSALNEQFSENQVGEPFILDLISELKEGGKFDNEIYVDKEDPNNEKRSFVREFQEKFLGFYKIDINYVLKCVSTYVNQLNNNPNVLNSVKEKAQKALRAIECAKDNNVDGIYYEVNK